MRYVRSYFPEGTSADAAFDKADPIIEGWGGWNEYFDTDEVYDRESAYTRFLYLWGKVRYRADETPLDNALKKATAYPLGTLRGQQRPVPQYDRFVSLAGWLQVTMGDKPILLPCRQVAEVLKTVPKMVSIWRNWAEEEGYICKVKEHTFRPGGKGEATEFRFDVGRWKILKAAAHRDCLRSFQEGVVQQEEKI